jgi:multidrug efflux pump subunit AcrA (membrane-fusion protein)
VKKDTLIGVFYLTLLFLTGCVTRDDSEIPTFTVLKTDFNDVLTIEGTVEPVRTTNLFCPGNTQGVAVYLIQDGVYVNEGDIVCVIEDSNLDNEYESALINLENAFAGLNKTKADLEMQFALLEAEVKNNEASTEIANLDSLQLKYSSENIRRIRELELQKAALEKQKLIKKLKTLKIIQQSEIRKQEMSIQRHTNTINSLKQRMEMLTIKSPASGMATRAIHWITGNKIVEGDPVWDGLPLIVIPDMQEMKVMINATEADYKRINLQNTVAYTFDAMPDNKAWGKILKKAPVGKPLSQNSKVKIFEVEASVDSARHLLTPGLSTSCQVTITQANDTISIPLIAVFDQDSMKVVYIKKNNHYEMRQVLTGISSLKSTVVTAGLTYNEKIALLKPGNTFIKEKTLLPDSILREHNFKRPNQQKQ